MNDRIPGIRVEGRIEIDGSDPYHRSADLLQLRCKVGMVFQKPNPFPMTIFENIALWPRMHYGAKGTELEEIVERALHQAVLWNEENDDLKKQSGLFFSGRQQQRLCVARMLAVDPEIILMDEPCSALDPVSTAKIEAFSCRAGPEPYAGGRDPQLATDGADQRRHRFFHVRRARQRVFRDAQHQATQDYVTGRFG